MLAKRACENKTNTACCHRGCRRCSYCHRNGMSKVLYVDRREAHLPEPEFNQNAAFVWVTFKRTTINTYNHTSSPYNHTTPQPLNPTSSPLNPSTSNKNNKVLKLKAFLSIIGENGASLKMLMEGMHLRDRKSFVNNYINPNLVEGYIAMLYPEIPNHPMQSYYLTNKGRGLLEQL